MSETTWSVVEFRPFMLGPSRFAIRQGDLRGIRTLHGFPCTCLSGHQTRREAVEARTHYGVAWDRTFAAAFVRLAVALRRVGRALRRTWFLRAVHRYLKKAGIK